MVLSGGVGSPLCPAAVVAAPEVLAPAVAVDVAVVVPERSAGAELDAGSPAFVGFSLGALAAFPAEPVLALFALAASWAAASGPYVLDLAVEEMAGLGLVFGWLRHPGAVVAGLQDLSV